MGVRNKKQVEHRTEVQKLRTQNVAAVFLFVAAAAIVILVIWSWRSQQTPSAGMSPFLMWDQPTDKGYRSHFRLGAGERVSDSDKSITDEEQLKQKLDTWANTEDQVSLVYLFGQAFFDDGRLVLRNTEGGAVDLVQELKDRAKAKASISKQLIAFWDLGDGLRTEREFVTALEKQLKDAPDNLWLIVSHDNQQSSRWLAQTQTTVFEAALRQVLLEQRTDLHHFHESLAKWVAALTIDCEGAALQSVPKVLSNGTSNADLSQIKWKWNSVAKKEFDGENFSHLNFEKPESADESNSSESLKLSGDTDVANLSISDLPKSASEKISSVGTESRRFVDLMARLSCDVALYRFSVDAGLLSKKRCSDVTQELDKLLQIYSSSFAPKPLSDDPAKAMLELRITDGSLQEFGNAIEKLEHVFAGAIEGSHGDPTPKSLHHAEQMKAWNGLIDLWLESDAHAPWSVASADAPAESSDQAAKKKRKWPFKFDATKLTEVAKPNVDKRVGPDDWRAARRGFFTQGSQAELFPMTLTPLADWSWPNLELIKAWRAAKIVADAAIVNVKFTPEDAPLQFNISGQAQLKGTVEFSNSPLGIELEFVDYQDLKFTWQIQVPSTDASAEPNPDTLSRAGPKTVLEAGPQPGSGKYKLTVTVESTAESNRPAAFGLIALAKNIERAPTQQEKRFATDFLKLVNVEVHVEAKCPGMERPKARMIDTKPEGGHLVLEPLPNLVSEYQFWLTSDADLSANAERINGLWDVELRQGKVVLATAKAVFNSRETKEPEFLAWTARTEATILDPSASLSLVIVAGGQDRTPTEIKLRPKSWSDLVKRPDQLPPTEWAGQPFLKLVDDPVDPVENWKDYNAAWESKLGTSLEKLRKKDGDKGGVVAEYRAWPIQAGGMVKDVVRYDAIRDSEKGLPFPMNKEAKDCFLIASLYGWPQALRYTIDKAGDLEREQELYGVFLEPKECELDPPGRGWAEPDGSSIYKNWHFYRMEPNGSPLMIKILAKDHGKARLNARWYVNDMDGREAQFKFRNQYASDEVSSRELTLPATTKLVWLHPLQATDGEAPKANHMAICAGVMDTAIFPESEEELLHDKVNTDQLTFGLQRSKILENEWQTISTLMLERGKPKKSE